MLELRAALARRARDVATAGPAGFAPLGGMPSAQRSAGEAAPVGWPPAAGASGGGQPLSPGGEDGEDGRARREHKRKLAPRYQDLEEDAAPSPPKAAKRPKPSRL